MTRAVIAVALGAALGALLRFGLSSALRSSPGQIPPGTLASNLLGGYLVGIAVVVVARNPHLAAEWRLFVITGFLGGLTTFSTFSAEVIELVQSGRPAVALGAIAAHLFGSLAMTALGIGTARLLRTG